MGGAGEQNNTPNTIDDGASAATTTPAPATATRIFVGGLGGSVTVEDLRNTFSSLGKVDSVEIVRTKGRSFAYLDFLPSSHNSLSKLLSTYNGCMWKGGKLRLEKAKEHYVIRLRREWAEDAKLASSAPSCAVNATRLLVSPEKLNNVLNSDKLEVRLFFPKLKKVKILPFSGTGKHKYSFQRIEALPLPIHFCDCEEHSDYSQTAKGKDFPDLDTLGSGIDEKELNMMNLVMNKLFERENIVKSACNRDGLIKEGDNATRSIDDPVDDENERDHMTDDDNLVMNMVEGDNATRSIDDLVDDENERDHMTDDDDLVMNMVGGVKTRKVSLRNQVQETILTKEGAIVSEQRTSTVGLFGNSLKGQKKKTVPSAKKRKLPITEEIKGVGIVSANLERKGVAKTFLHESAQAIKPESGIQQSNTKRSRSKKSTWKDLAGERGDTSFSISQILQCTAATEEESKPEHENRNLVKNIDMEFPSNLSEEPKELAVTQVNIPEPALNKSARGALWLQKSSWTQLIGETNSSFSISQLLPGMNFEKQEQVEPKSMDVTNSNISKYFKFVKTGSIERSGDGSQTSGASNEDSLVAPDSSNRVAMVTGLDSELSPPQKNLQSLGETGKIIAQKENQAATAEPLASSFKIGETCSFMRSASSMKEWMSAKAALSGSLKKSH